MQSAHTILFFAPLPDELDVWPLLEKRWPAEKSAPCPAFDSATQTYVARRVQNLTDRNCRRDNSASASRRPVARKFRWSKFDLILVPGVAFDWRGHRLGRGKGFYDRLLAEMRGIKCGVAFDEQMVEEMPAGTHDVRMDFIVTPTRCVRT